MKFETECRMRSEAEQMMRIRRAAMQFTNCAQELHLTPREAHLAANLMERNAHQFLIPDRMDRKATPNQILFLESKGFRDVQEWPWEAARDMVDAIAANAWSVPGDVDPDNYKPENVG